MTLERKLGKQLAAFYLMKEIGVANLHFKSGGVMRVDDVIDIYKRKIRKLERENHCSCGDCCTY